MIGRDRLKDEWQKEQASFDGQALRQWRLRPGHNLTQDAMAALLGLQSCNAVRSIQEWESGRTKMPGWVPRMIWLLDKVEKATLWGCIRTEMAEGETPWVKPPPEEYVPYGFNRPKRKYTRRNLAYWALHPGWGRGTAAELKTRDHEQGIAPEEGPRPSNNPS